MKQLTKTDFISYLECRNNVWIKWHRFEDYKKFPVSEFEKSLGETGVEVEELARRMFPLGYLIERRSEGAQELTKKLITEHQPVIFQAVFSTDKYWNEKAGAYDLYEIKMSSAEEDDEDDQEGKPKKIKKSSGKDKQYEYDLAFQANVLEMCNVPIHKKYLIRLNKKYKKIGDLDIRLGQLFIDEDKTEAVYKRMAGAKVEMEEAHTYLSSAVAPSDHCPCYYKGRSSHCTTFSLSNPGLPPYTVHDLNRIGNR